MIRTILTLVAVGTAATAALIAALLAREVIRDARWQRTVTARRLPIVTDDQVAQQIRVWDQMWHHPSNVARWD